MKQKPISIIKIEDPIEYQLSETTEESEARVQAARDELERNRRAPKITTFMPIRET